jgi:hypothetical protein
MTEMRRLIQGDDDELAAELLKSALEDAPRAGEREKLLVALGVAGATLAVAGKAAGATGAAAAVSKVGSGSAATALVVKWVGVGLIAGGLGTGAVVGVSSWVEPRPKPATPSAVPMDQPVVRGATQPRRAVEAPAVPSAEPAPAPASAPAPAPSVADEIAVLDRAREALRSGDASAARAALDDHQARFGQGVLTPEAELLRIELLLSQGQKTAAQSLGQRFLASHPRSPLAARVRQLLRQAEGASAVPPSPPASNVARFPEE